MRKTALRVIGALNTLVYRWSKGRLLGQFPSGAPVCLLTTIGRRSGRARTVPLLYLQDGADFVVVASQGGATQHPSWYLNVLARPEADLELRGHRVPVIAHTVNEAERTALWPRLVAIYPPYERYQQRTTRRIPVVRLAPRPGT